MPPSPGEILKAARLYTDPQDYDLIRLPARAITAAASVVAEHGEPFAALIIDKDEVTLMLPAGVADEFRKRLPDMVIATTPYRLITIDIETDLAIVGLMAHLSRALAALRIPIMAVAAYSRDHILVPADKVELALGALKKLQDEA